MPIANDFFQTFESLEISNNPWVLREAVIHYLHHDKKINNPIAYLRSGIDIEELHSEIADKVAEVSADDKKSDRLKYKKINDELIYLFSSTLNSIANGPISENHIEIAKRLNEDDVVITFNWDTLMERALMEVRQWRTDDGYCFKPYSIYRDEWQEPNKVDGKSPPIIKLHGSTNWLTGVPVFDGKDIALTHGLSNDSVCIFEYATQPYSTYAGKYMEGYGTLTYGYYPPNLLTVPGLAAPEGYSLLSIRLKAPWKPESKGESKGVTSMPLIIPPVKDKNYDLFGSLFRDLWVIAADAIVNCDEIILIGYSFPATDLRSLALFRDSFMKKKTMPKVFIIDPSPERPRDIMKWELGIPEDYIKVIPECFNGKESLSYIAQ